MMQKVTTWMWKEPGQERREDAYWYDGKNVIIVRGNQEPKESKEILDAEQQYLVLKLKGRDNLRFEHTKALYDFLAAKF